MRGAGRDQAKVTYEIGILVDYTAMMKGETGVELTYKPGPWPAELDD